jgi:hypothetical protein
MAFAPKPVAGSKLSRKTGPSTYALIEGLEGLELSGGEREEQTVRPMNATSPITLTGAIGALTASAVLYYNPSDTVHAAMATAFANNSEETFKMEQSDGVIFYFKGYIKTQLKIPNFPAGGVIQHNFAIGLSSDRSDTEL